MATSSITKQFVINTNEAYNRFVDLQTQSVIIQPTDKSAHLQKGLEKLKQFSFRSSK